MYELFSTLDCVHSEGIMHRDIKPENILVQHIPNKNLRKLILIDWGLAEFYHKNQSYHCRVASRYYKAPELLVNFDKYSYSVDIWSIGCIFASLLFNSNSNSDRNGSKDKDKDMNIHSHDAFFMGKDNNDQLIQICKVLGSDEMLDYLSKYNLHLPSEFDYNFGYFAKKPWIYFVNNNNKYKIFNNNNNNNNNNNDKSKLSNALNLIDKLLVYDHNMRFTCKEAMKHDYFKSIRRYVCLSMC